jgi:hypothetical protein
MTLSASLAMTMSDRFARTVLRRGGPTVKGSIVNALAHSDRCLRFVRTVAERYDEANSMYVRHRERFKAMTKGVAGPVTAEASEEFLAEWAAGETLYLEIESFYFFAKILLDRVADIVHLYFGHPRPRAGSSHSRLVKGVFAQICGTKAIDGRALVPMMKDLHQRVVKHKTDVVEHLVEPRWIPGIELGADRRANVSMGLMSPRADETHFDTQPTEDPVILLKEIEGYVAAVIDFLETNIEKSVLGQAAATS